MAIDPNTVNILNVNELLDATTIQYTDLLIVGQGIYARKSTILNLYNKFGIDAIKDNVTDLQQKIEEIELLNPVLYTPQLLNAPQQQVARDNINSLDRDMEELSNSLSTSQKDEIKHKLSINDSLWGLKQW